MKYLVDTDVLIDAKNRHYPFDVCPAFWAWLESANADGKVHSVAKVYEEICAGKDELTTWAKQRPGFFLDPDEDVVQSMREVAAWVTSTNPQYEAAAVNAFLNAADYYLVSHAHAHGLVVVTAEVAADTVKKVKIPNACQGVNVKYTDVFTMLRTSGARFVMP